MSRAKQISSTFALAALALLVAGNAQARKDDMDVDRLNNSLNQLASDPTLGNYAQADQALARDAIGRLAQASSKDQPHLLYIAQRRVDQARAEAQLEASQRQLTQLDQENAQLQLDRSRIDAAAAQQELDLQRTQFQMAQQQAARLAAQGQAAAAQAAQAQAEADQAKKLAAAQSKLATAAKRQAALATKAAKAARELQQQDSSSGSDSSGH